LSLRAQRGNLTTSVSLRAQRGNLTGNKGISFKRLLRFARNDMLCINDIFCNNNMPFKVFVSDF